MWIRNLIVLVVLMGWSSAAWTEEQKAEETQAQAAEQEKRIQNTLLFGFV